MPLSNLSFRACQGRCRASCGAGSRYSPTGEDRHDVIASVSVCCADARSAAAEREPHIPAGRCVETTHGVCRYNNQMSKIMPPQNLIQLQRSEGARTERYRDMLAHHMGTRKHAGWSRFEESMHVVQDESRSREGSRSPVSSRPECQMLTPAQRQHLW